MPEPLVKVEGLTKILCKDFRRSLLYGATGMMRELLGFSRERATLRTGEFRALDRIDFELAEGDSLGLVGANGAGKTTLLRVISGLLIPDAGSVSVRGRVGALIALGAGFNPILTGRENIYTNAAVLGFSRTDTEARFDEIVDFAELDEFIDTPLQSYSSGMQARLGFAVAAQLEPDLLLVDEVLAVGDMAFRAKCYRRISSLLDSGTGIILVSHQAHTLLSVCKTGLLLDRGRAQGHGAIEDVISTYENLLAERAPIAQGPERLVDDRRREATIDGVTLHDAAGTRVDALCCRAPGAIHVQYHAQHDLPRITVGIIIRGASGDDMPVVALNAARDADWLDLQGGSGELRFIMPSVNLRPGKYRAKVTLMQEPVHVVDAIEVADLMVRSTTAFGNARFHQPGHWEVVAKPAVNATTDRSDGGPSRGRPPRPG